MIEDDLSGKRDVSSMEFAQPPSGIPVENNNVNSEGTVLSEDEALDLATHLKEQLLKGKTIASDPDSISRMVAGLGDRRGLLRLRFADSLGAVGSKAVPALCHAMLQSNQVTVRRAAAKTLTLIADPDSLPDLVEALLNDSDSVVQGSAMGAMAAIGAESVSAILSILESTDSSEMQIGLANWALAFIGDRAPHALRQAAGSPNPSVRKAAISALGSQIQSLDDSEARSLLTNALEDSCSEIRAEAVTLLGKLEDNAWGEPLLVPALSDPDSWVRKNSALSLMKLQATSSLSTLKKCLAKEQDPVVVRVMNLAVRQLEQDD